MTDQLVALAREAEQLTKENIELRHKLRAAERERDEEHEAHEQIADHLLPLVGTADGSSVSAAQRAAVEIKHLRKKLESAESALRAQQDAIRWALGELGDFPARQEGQGAYWWRTELRRRAAMPPAPAETGEEK